MRTRLAAIAVGMTAVAVTAVGTAAAAPAAPGGSSTVEVTSVSARSLDAGDTLTVEGSASPDLKGALVYLQVRAAGKKWDRIGTDIITKRGKFSLSSRILTSGAGQAIRVVVPKSAKNPAPVAKAAGKITVYGWFNISDGRIDIVEGDFETGFYEVNGEPYPDSIAQSMINGAGPGPVTAQIGLSRDCTTFEATVGMSDTAASEARWSTTLRADDLALWSQGGMQVGYSYPVTLNITGALRMSFDSTRDTWANGHLVFGDARVRCAF
jgi:hypothetical protein